MKTKMYLLEWHNRVAVVLGDTRSDAIRAHTQLYPTLPDPFAVTSLRTNVSRRSQPVVLSMVV